MSVSTIKSEAVIAKFRTVRETESVSKDVYRVAITTQEEADRWLLQFQRISGTHWIVDQTYPHAIRYVIAIYGMQCN